MSFALFKIRILKDFLENDYGQKWLTALILAPNFLI